jgi:hypothetical protein
MDKKLKEEEHDLCQKIRTLTIQLDKSIEKIEKPQQNFLLQNVKIENKEKFVLPAGKRATKWDSNIINWKNSLRYRF